MITEQARNYSKQNHIQPESRKKFIYHLLHGTLQNEGNVLEIAKQLEIDLIPPRAVILIHDIREKLEQNVDFSEVNQVDLERRSQTIIRGVIKFFHLPDDTICINLGQGEICVLKASDTKNLDLWAKGKDGSRVTGASWADLMALKRAANGLLEHLNSETDHSIDIGIGRYHPGISGIAQSYQDAQVAIALGKHFQGHNRVHCLSDLGIAAFIGISDGNTKVDLAKYLLSPLDHEPELITTLNIFFDENCCPSSAAKRLSIHRNTLSYRLEKIFSLTGLEPRKFDDAVQMRLCLMLRSWM
jgi:carbohydrate diacid regulator